MLDVYLKHNSQLCFKLVLFGTKLHVKTFITTQYLMQESGRLLFGNRRFLRLGSCVSSLISPLNALVQGGYFISSLIIPNRKTLAVIKWFDTVLLLNRVSHA